ncbi:ATP-binding cassette domain-containing protein [Kutzneria buriramensis]|uniref:ABC-2 type transport system ATP-binding protein n=1 Tax=Kutzneria buriramensis TaxID=1045776 RepID=A0A3E0HCM2_9PSEU|nr:ATP-binding cassette domain-containing protein [Kutzneria buriramensis]REH42536.1 ABC-2 type transport system ATP-binding protein [Kutzneria buriramensis]
MIVARGLTKRYGSVTAVDDLSFTVQPGVVTGFLGPNGAGKSTTMRLMLGLDHGAGRTEFDGRGYGELAHPARTVGVMLDARAVHPGRTARAHLSMVAAGAGLPSGRVDRALDRVGLLEVANRRAGGFSLGMSQRLGLAAALLGDPGTLMLDEPANGLDPEGVRWLRDLLKAFAAEGRTVFVSSHQLNEMAVLADALVVIGQGRLVAAEATNAFVARNSRPEVLVRASDPGLLAHLLGQGGLRAMPSPDGALVVDTHDTDAVATIAMHAGIVLRELTVRHSSLEDAFFAATAGAAQFRGRA